MRWRRALIWIAAMGILFCAALLAAMYREARADPIIRRAEIGLVGLSRGTALKVVLLGDIHIGARAMDAARLDRIVAQVNALEPDLVLIAGDFIYGHAPDSAARLGAPMVAPLAKLQARWGIVAVLGNHDHWTGAPAVRAQLARANVALIENEAVVRGPIAIGGIGDDFSGHDDIAATLAAVRATRRPFVLLTHSPDVAPDLPPDAALLLAGHTHCGQGVLPLIRIAPEVSRYGDRYRCGLIREDGRTVIVTSGLGASALPLRLNAPPDLWLLTLRSG